ncbi:RNA polymerase sigma-70 factor, ECF subfamily [Neorhodopirellula lusitana]|uniref:RNA polymerase sigma-70 factor, ECF subfamily n=1 Tax=Neorhodopirellula lusitana TaxID=445327 RepID=A0ABY1QAF4_9BACT|nr:sigma-70 family RNA polymerase sigma factor [Neorhodopirellula lusitana]SMP64326.1 RNA polymerase sigma-70 factor, ECF subfamily [Neorhodopirellula lusitana]
MNPVSEEKSQDEFVRLLASVTTQLMSYIRILAFNNREDTDEVFQRTCLVLWQKFDQYDADGNFAAWACRTAYFEVLKLRDARRKVQLLGDSAMEALAIAAIPLSEQWSQRRHALVECVEKLDDDHADLIKRRYFDGADVQTIADATSRSIHSIYRELTRIYGILMRCVETQSWENTV